MGQSAGFPSWSVWVYCLSPAAVAQLAERVICNLEVTGSIPVGGFSVGESVRPVERNFGPKGRERRISRAKVRERQGARTR